MAKSTVSEDLAIIRDVLSSDGCGRVLTVSGPNGGVLYRPEVSPSREQEILARLCRLLSSKERILPGGFLYINDIASDPKLLWEVALIFARRFADVSPDLVATVETLGIPLATFVARALGVPLAIARRVSKVSDGSVVTMNYLSGSARRLETMSLSTRTLSSGDVVLIVDDFMKAGGTARGLADLVREFGATPAGIGVLIATSQPANKLVTDYVSLLTLEEVDERQQKVVIRPTEDACTKDTGRRS